ncbi:hypothetical protein [Pontibacter actiniarum]|uniref:STAS/SEC14 domain-containing protein n=1 Tax=Pontibacter actiniarum TaxID=323450 RepID=A0A1X9YXH4_9BACT|nr:hypothetical protein [Pontibacter actiniarum]ARS37481.1 hypothetical protein CA264_19765 [Pontibacter actiniarum]
MKKELRNNQDEVYFTLEVDKLSGWLRGCWYGSTTTEQVKLGSLLYVEGLQRSPYSKILNDTRYSSCSFLDANEWMERVCMPPAVQAGLTCLVHLIPENIESTLSVEDFCRRARDNFRTLVIDCENEAIEWLKGCR